MIMTMAAVPVHQSALRARHRAGSSPSIPSNCLILPTICGRIAQHERANRSASPIEYQARSFLHLTAIMHATLAAPGAAPVGLGSTGNPVFNVPASMLGIPALSLPVLSAEGLPLGLQIMAL